MVVPKIHSIFILLLILISSSIGVQAQSDSSATKTIQPVLTGNFSVDPYGLITFSSEKPLDLGIMHWRGRLYLYPTDSEFDQEKQWLNVSQSDRLGYLNIRRSENNNYIGKGEGRQLFNNHESASKNAIPKYIKRFQAGVGLSYFYVNPDPKIQYLSTVVTFQYSINPNHILNLDLRFKNGEDDDAVYISNGAPTLGWTYFFNAHRFLSDKRGFGVGAEVRMYSQILYEFGLGEVWNWETNQYEIRDTQVGTYWMGWSFNSTLKYQSRYWCFSTNLGLLNFEHYNWASSNDYIRTDAIVPNLGFTLSALL